MDYREIQRFADDPVRVRNLAKLLLTVPGLSDGQTDFLSDMAAFKGRISTRQGEFLLGIRDDMQEVASFAGFHVAALIRKCWLGRLDLNEADEEFIDGLKGRTRIRYKYGGRLLRCAKQLELID
jgi:hypothetical protein